MIELGLERLCVTGVTAFDIGTNGMAQHEPYVRNKLG